MRASGARLEHGLRCQALLGSPQVFSQIRNEHFSSVFGFLSQKSRNLQAQYDVSATLGSRTPVVPSQYGPVTSPRLCLLQRRRGMDIKQMKTFVSQELKGLKQEHRLLSLRRSRGGGREGGALGGCCWGCWGRHA